VKNRISMKASAESREKDEYSLIETWRAVKGARRAFILTLDGPLRLTESTWERSETNFSEASFPKGHDSILSRSSCIIASTKAPPVIVRVNSVRPRHLSDRSSDHDYFFELPFNKGAGYPINTGDVLLHTISGSGLPHVRTEF
jgi:hypothetical protein